MDKKSGLHRSARNLLRKVLGHLVRRTIKKHSPLIIAVTGEYDPSTLREILYSIASTRYNARRNLERTESEFSIPLAILGVLYYPGGYFQWIFLILKTFIQLIYLKRYKHALVIQINRIDSSIYKFWLDTVSPNFVVNSGTKELKDVNHSYNIPRDEMDLISSGVFTETLKKLCKDLEIETKQAETVIKNLPSPMPRINFIPAKSGSTIIDARHYYHPPSIEAVIEIANSLPGAKYIFTDVKTDFGRIPGGYIINSSLPQNLPNDSVYIFRGSKNKYLKEI